MKRGNQPEPLDSLALCPVCKVTKPRSHYYANPTSRSGYQYCCKECSIKASKRRYDELKAAREELIRQRRHRDADKQGER